MKEKEIQINPVIKSILAENNLVGDQYLLYLVSIQLQLNTAFFPDKLKSSVDKLNLYKKILFKSGPRKGQLKEIEWKFSPISYKKDPWGWIKDWREGWRELVHRGAPSERVGSLAECTKRMQLIFKENPTLRAEDAYKARDFYFSKLNNLEFLKKSHKFIYDFPKDQKGRQSIMLEAIEVLEELGEQPKKVTFNRNKIK